MFSGGAAGAAVPVGNGGQPVVNFHNFQGGYNMAQKYTGSVAVASVAAQPLSPMTKKAPMMASIMESQQQNMNQQQMNQQQLQQQQLNQQQLNQQQMNQQQMNQQQMNQQQQNVMATYSVAAINNRPNYMNQQQNSVQQQQQQQHMVQSENSPHLQVHLINN